MQQIEVSYDQSFGAKKFETTGPLGINLVNLENLQILMASAHKILNLVHEYCIKFEELLKRSKLSFSGRRMKVFRPTLCPVVKEKLSAEEYRKFVEFMKALKSKEMKISQVLQSIVRLFSGPQRLHLLESEREALVSFKEGVIDIPGKLSSWVGEDCCQWKGVECDDSGHVTKLNLSNPAGRHRHFDYYERYQYYPTKAVVAISKNRNRPCAPTAVCSDICSTGVPYSRGRGCRSLLGDVNSSFSRDVNASLSGEITRYLRNLSSLTHLDLEGNYNLSTKNFDWVSSLSSLQYLYMGGVKINPTKADWLQAINMLPSLLELIEFIFINQVGKILASFGRLERLKYLYLGANHFSGSIPASIGNLSSLKELDLSYNKMNGTIPESFGQLSKLVKLYLLENSWECVITEAQLMNLTRLEEFVLTTNNKSQPLVFNVKDNWRPPFKLKILHLESCLIGPKFTKWLQVQSELTYVILKNVEIKGTIPEEWFSMISSNLAHLDLSNNQIKGNLPHQLVFPNVTKLFLQSNLFSGTILSNISDLMPSLQYLDLSENHLCGVCQAVEGGKESEDGRGGCVVGSGGVGSKRQGRQTFFRLQGLDKHDNPIFRVVGKYFPVAVVVSGERLGSGSRAIAESGIGTPQAVLCQTWVWIPSKRLLCAS
nr:leucine-rich repeat receptor-like protein kinase pxl1 [Quercus suber]